MVVPFGGRLPSERGEQLQPLSLLLIAEGLPRARLTGVKL